MSGNTVLVIDDDASIHRAVERRLEGVVDQVLKADSPTKGIQIAIQEKPDVILLDLNMPQIDGIIGRGTRGAIRTFQKAQGDQADGKPSAALLEKMRKVAQSRGLSRPDPAP